MKLNRAAPSGMIAREDHRQRVHREELVEELGADDVAVGDGELRADQQRLHAAEQEEDERADAVEDADALMVDAS